MSINASKLVLTIVILHVCSLRAVGAPSEVPKFRLAREIVEARTISYRTQTDGGDTPSMVTKVTMSSTGFVRIEGPDGSVSIRDRGRGRVWIFTPQSNTCVITQSSAVVAVDFQGRICEQIGWLKELLAGNGKFCKWDLLGERPAELWVLQQDDGEPYLSETRVWVDKVRRSIERVETRELPNPDFTIPSIGIRTGDFSLEDDTLTVTPAGRSDRNLASIRFEFEWSAVIDTTLFQMEPPEGAAVHRLTKTLESEESPSAAVELQQALSLWAESSRGQFPRNVEDLADEQQVGDFLLKKYSKQIPMADITPLVRDAQTFVRAALLIESLRRKYATLEYRGRDVLLGDEGAVLCWWGPIDENNDCLVMYGNLKSVLVPESKVRQLR